MITKNKRRIGALQHKILTLILGGIAFGLSQSPKRQLKLIREDIPKDLAKDKLRSLEYGLHRLFKSDLIGIKKLEDGTYEPYLTKEGKAIALDFELESITVDIPKYWDKKWRVVIFDIPEKYKRKRNALRYHLNRIGFREIQKSSLCYPHDCSKEVLQIATSLGLEKYILYLVVEEISNENKLRHIFNL